MAISIYVLHFSPQDPSLSQGGTRPVILSAKPEGSRGNGSIYSSTTYLSPDGILRLRLRMTPHCHSERSEESRRKEQYLWQYVLSFSRRDPSPSAQDDNIFSPYGILHSLWSLRMTPIRLPVRRLPVRRMQTGTADRHADRRTDRSF